MECTTSLRRAFGSSAALPDGFTGKITIASTDQVVYIKEPIVNGHVPRSTETKQTPRMCQPAHDWILINTAFSGLKWIAIE
jgi:hypothetical protein